MTSILKKSMVPPEALQPALPGFERIRRYWDTYNRCYSAKILPGEYYVTNNDELIVTTLGSCISACIRDHKSGIGGMNHFMLPHNVRLNEKRLHPSVKMANRYGNYAMENLINEILKNGGDRDNLEIKIFGGGKILAQMTDIGKRNIDFIDDYIATEQLNLAARDVGSIHPRKVVFNHLTGKVKVKRLKSLHNNTIIDRETRYLQDIQNQGLSGDVEIF